MLGVPVNEILWLVAAILTGGVITGILAGLFGIGGGAVIVPVLYEIFRVLGVPEDVRMQLCVGTSLAIIVPTTIRSYFAHRAKGAVIPGVVSVWGPPAVVGVVVGAAIASVAPATFFKIAFVVFVTAVGLKMLLGRESWNVSAELPGRTASAVYGFITGLCSSLVGVSGGSVSNAVLTLHGQTMQRAVATSAGIGVPITLAGAVGYMAAGWRHMAVLPPLSIGFVSLIGVALMAPVSSYAASYGVRLAHWLPKRKLEIAFGCFLALASARFIVSLF